MSVTREILGVKKKAQAPKAFENLFSTIAPSAEPKKNSGKKQSREVQSLLKGEKMDLEISTPAKERLGWARVAFDNPARSDNFRLSHWEKKRPVRPPGYGGALSVIPFPLPALPEEFKFPGWGREELVHMWETCRETEIRFPVVAEKLKRSTEEIKEVFYAILKNLEIPGFKARGVFDINSERQRRELLEEKFSGNFKSLEILKNAQAELKSFKDSDAEAQRLLKDPASPERRNFQVWWASEEKPESLGARVAKLRCLEGAHRRLRHCHKVRRMDLEISRLQELERNLKNFIKERERQISELS